MSKLAIHGGKPVLSRKHIQSRMFIEYPLAEKFASYVGSSYALLTSSGTAALFSSLMAAGVGPGDEVITVSYTWYCTATSILQCGAVPIFVDIDPVTFTLDPSKIEERISDRTKVILAVSLYGHPANYRKINEIAKKHNLIVIDDACQSTGASIEGVRLGAVADITAFSFSGKPLVSTGGGVVTTNRHELYERAMLVGEHPSFISTSTKNKEIWRLASTGGYGYHTRIDGKCAERAYEYLEKIDALNGYRQKNARYLISKLKSIKGVTPPSEKYNSESVFHMFTCLFDENEYGITRDEFVHALNAEGLPVTRYISSVNFIKDLNGREYNAGPLHLRYLFQELYKKGHCGPYKIKDISRIDYSKGSLPVTEALCELELNIHQRFLGAPYTQADLDQYVEVFQKVLENTDEIIENRGKELKFTNQFMMAYESDA